MHDTQVITKKRYVWTRTCNFPCKRSTFLLTMNLCTDAGFCCGVTVIIVDFIYASNMQPPDLPIAVVVKFDDYAGPSLSNVLMCTYMSYKHNL